MMKNFPKSSKIYEIMVSFSTLAGVSYEIGDMLILIEPTTEAPFGRGSNLCNWVVKCKHFSPPDPHSIWSNIWMAIEDGSIKGITS